MTQWSNVITKLKFVDKLEMFRSLNIMNSSNTIFECNVINQNGALKTSI